MRFDMEVHSQPGVVNLAINFITSRHSIAHAVTCMPLCLLDWPTSLECHRHGLSYACHKCAENATDDVVWTTDGFRECNKAIQYNVV